MDQIETKQNKTKRNIIIGASISVVVVAIILLCCFLIPRANQKRYKLDIFCSNCTVDNTGEYHGEFSSNEKVSLTFKADLHCVLPDDVDATIGDKQLKKDKDYSYSVDTGEMSIKLKGNTSISVCAPCTILSFDVALPAHTSFDVGFDYSKDSLLNETSYPGVVDWGDGTKNSELSHHFDEQDEKKNYTISIHDYSYDYFAFDNLSSTDYIKTLFIPSSVSKIKERSFADFKGLTSVAFANDNKLVSIGGYAFSKCGSLSSVTLPKGLASIGEGAFSSCVALSSITIPSKVVFIDSYAFSNCSKLDKIAFEEDSQLTSIGEYAFSGCGLSSIALPENVISLKEGSFSDCEKLTSVTIPESIVSIGDYAFFACSSLDSIVIPKSVTNMGYFAMYIGGDSETPYIFCEANATPLAWNNNWTRNTSVVYWAAVDAGANDEYSYVIQNFNGSQTITLMNYISETEPVDIVIPSTIDVNGTPIPVTGIGDNIFKNCTTLNSVSIPKSITTIGANAFNGCTRLMTVTLEEGLQLTSVGDYAFNGDGYIRNNPIITISKNMTYIGDYAFNNTRFQFVLEEGNQLTYIGDYALRGTSFTSPTSFAFFDGLTSIGECAFSGCKNLASITIPNSITSIGAKAFENCTGLETVTFEEGIQLASINENVFYGDSKLASITIPNTVTSIGSGAFSGAGLTSITIPNTITSIESYAFNSCRKLAEVTFEEGIQLASINDSVFASNTILTSIAIPNTVTSIGSYAFNSSGLTSITIPSSVTSIGERAFERCSNLAEVIFENNGEQITTIGNYAFASDSKLTSITLPTGITSIGEQVYSKTGITTFIIPNYITSIGEETFGSCVSLTTVGYDENSKLETIGESAFYGCTALNSISIPNSVTSIGYNAFYRINANAVIDLTTLDHVIALDYALFYSNFAGQIKVSNAMLDQYKNGKVWSQYANYIVGVE